MAMQKAQMREMSSVPMSDEMMASKMAILLDLLKAKHLDCLLVDGKAMSKVWMTERSSVLLSDEMMASVTDVLSA